MQSFGLLLLRRFQATPDFKGIKTTMVEIVANMVSFRPPLISKGLRRREARSLWVALSFQATPDFKGIKTTRGTAMQSNIRVSGHP